MLASVGSKLEWRSARNYIDFGQAKTVHPKFRLFDLQNCAQSQDHRERLNWDSTAVVVEKLFELSKREDDFVGSSRGAWGEGGWGMLPQETLKI